MRLSRPTVINHRGLSLSSSVAVHLLTRVLEMIYLRYIRESIIMQDATSSPED